MDLNIDDMKDTKELLDSIQICKSLNDNFMDNLLSNVLDSTKITLEQFSKSIANIQYSKCRTKKDILEQIFDYIGITIEYENVEKNKILCNDGKIKSIINRNKKESVEDSMFIVLDDLFSRFIIGEEGLSIQCSKFRENKESIFISYINTQYELLKKDNEKRAKKVCNTLNSNFLEVLSTPHVDITPENLIQALFPLMLKADDRKYSISLLKLIGFTVHTKVKNLKFLFEIKFDDNENKVILRISDQVSLDDYNNICATAIADVLCHYTNGENKKLYSAYSEKMDTSQKNIFYAHENMEKIRLSILTTINVLDIANSKTKASKTKASNTEQSMAYVSQQASNNPTIYQEKKFGLTA